MDTPTPNLTLEISTSNVAFGLDPRWEIARILRNAAERIEQHEGSFRLTDDNGNVVGRVYWDGK